MTLFYFYYKIEEDDIIAIDNMTDKKLIWIKEDKVKLIIASLFIFIAELSEICTGYLNGAAVEAISNLKIKVPEQVSVIGFDDIKLSSFITPKLTTIAQDKKQIGFLAVKTLIDNINNDKFKTKHYKIEGILIERNSVKEL